MPSVSKRPKVKIEHKLNESSPDRSTIGLRNTTKERLNNNRAPGQCYDGFLCQLVDLWEKTKEEV